ncbi:MAG: hypothetical protein LPJ96_11600 [Exiguobacterium sp.]|uniref:Uncharacterized protein n=1 Tax=Exiguobacterium alkaliphilum TaxID=1428684 RepID=A0ABT2KV80_9BACL|nr:MULTISPECIES: hypothetical protein [Exiguobacterium]MDX5324249.1 hypothetical protein [Exiguobacterium sp.]KDN59284.1 hypothetical protein DI14_02565 [Exiguobacterium sp. AB2]MCT4793914.1 hypothetical protein [Exiguobacterium alkaliphilum]MDX5426084.1 hypothetical protein [Exiguobacterium sp.]MDX6773465.1 hypothetical protein [Exiguobacterium sp.]
MKTSIQSRREAVQLLEKEHVLYIRIHNGQTGMIKSTAEGIIVAIPNSETNKVDFRKLEDIEAFEAFYDLTLSAPGILYYNKETLDSN